MGQGPRFSKQAQELANKHGLTAHLFSGHSLVTRANVESYLARRAEPEKKNLSVVPAVSGSPGDAIVVLGGGGHARMCLDILQQRGEYKIVGILDPGLRKGEHVFGVPILGGDDCLPELAKNGVRLAVNGIGSVTQTAFREKVYSKLKDLGFTLPNLIHPRAVVEPSVQMGEGNQVMAGTVLGSAARVGNNCIINTSAVVSHDCVLEDHAHIAPGAILGGSVRVGPKSLIGMGVTIYFGLTIGHNVTIVNGVDVFGDVRDNTIVRGKISHG
jgi:sugar O-acyltransferase (sialic acid O-acetyltransferase NeuD family)